MRTGIYTFLGIVSIVIVVVLFMALSSVGGIETVSGNISSEEDLSKYFPLESFVWEYSDAKSFRKLMVTEQVYRSDKYTHLIVKGQEDDLSIKSYRDRYQFEYTYKIDEDKIIRVLDGNTLIDSYREVILLKKPLKEGTKWKDKWENTSGENFNISSQIKSIEEDGQCITIESKDDKGTFTIDRIIELGKGTVEVVVKESYDTVEFETGFQLFNFKEFEYKGFDNYMALLGNEKIGTLIDKIDEKKVPEQTSTLGDEQVPREEEERVLEDQDIDEETKAAITGSIQLFNEKWIDFINESDLSILETIVPEGSAERVIQAYMNKDMQQKFLAMDMQRVVVKGNVSNVYVYEEIERTMDGVTEVLIYNWIYEVDFIDGKWLVEGYIENKSF